MVLRQLAAYSATKGAVTALTKALAVEYAQYGIRVNTLAPGYIDTALTERFLKNPFVSKALLDKTPMRRFGTPEEIAQGGAVFRQRRFSLRDGRGAGCRRWHVGRALIGRAIRDR